MPESYRITLEGDVQQGWAGLEGQFGRVNVVLGANGTGKSKLLQRLRSMPAEFGGTRPVAYVEGGRVVKPPVSVALDRNTINAFRNLKQASDQHRQQKQNNLADRIAHLFVLLDRLGEQGRSAHSDAVTLWIRDGKPGDPPEREEPPLEKLFRLFSEIFPEIRIWVDPESKQVLCEKGGSQYNPNGLSDGERQVLALLADIAVLGDESSLVVVDEPELNLNVHLACRLWDSIEATLPKAVFVYGTHALGFAMRGNVEKIFVLSGQDRPAVEVSGIHELRSSELREFLGAIPAILAAPEALVVEGEDTSIDALFYEWLAGRRELVVVPVGDSASVRSAVTRTGVWERLAPGVALVGVVDRDFRSDEVLREFGGYHLVPLDLHECESYLCQPELIVQAADSIGIVEVVPTSDEVGQDIVEFLREHRLGVAARRAFSRLGLRPGVSVSRQMLGRISSEEELRKATEEAAESERRKVGEALGTDTVKTVLTQELARVDQAIQESDISEALRLAPGKELLPRLMYRTGARSPSELIRAVTKHLDPERFVHTRELKSQIKSSLEDVVRGEAAASVG